MHKFASFNHEILPVDEIYINAVSAASLYGKGVFTTLAIYNGEPFLWDKHWRRIRINAGNVGIDLSAFSEQRIKQSLFEIIEKNAFEKGRCRLTFFDESASKMWQSNIENRTSFLIQTANFRPVKQNISVTLSPFVINLGSPLIGIKSCNYLENLVSLEDARSRGFDEAIRINEKNQVVSACMANIFWFEFDKKRLFTPGLQTGCLAGTTREFLMENYEVVGAEKEINELFRDAKYLFLTSSGRGIVQISDFNKEIKFENRLHELTNAINRDLSDSSAAA